MRNSSNVWSVFLSGDDGPCLRGTGADLMPALAYLQRWETAAVFSVFPAEPACSLGRRLDETMTRARRLARVWPEHVITLGVPPHGADPQRSYLTLGDEVWGTDGMRRVTGLVDRPSLFEARELRSAGAMWNTRIACATAGALWELARVTQPAMMELFDGFVPLVETPEEDEALALLADRVPAVDLSRDLIERAPGRALMLQLDGVEWSDWGRPERIEVAARS